MLSLQAISLIPKQFIIPLPQKHIAILVFLAVWIKQTLGNNSAYRTGYQTICSHWGGNPVSLGVTKGNTTLFFYPSPSVSECCYCNFTLQYSLLKESIHMITLQIATPGLWGHFQMPTSAARRGLPTCPSPKTWKWRCIFPTMDWPTLPILSLELSDYNSAIGIDKPTLAV